MPARWTAGWRSLEPRELFENQRYLNSVYMSTVAESLQSQGYALDVDHKTGTFEVKGVPEGLIALHSSRSAEIDEQLKKWGIDRDKATPEERERAALATRQGKQETSAEAMRERWTAEAKAHGWNGEAVRVQPKAIDRDAEADKAVKFAADHISERESRFTRSEMVGVALGRGLGKITLGDVERAVTRAQDRGDLVRADFDKGNRASVEGMTTRQAIENERRLLDREQQGRGTREPLMTRAEARNRRRRPSGLQRPSVARANARRSRSVEARSDRTMLANRAAPPRSMARGTLAKPQAKRAVTARHRHSRTLLIECARLKWHAGRRAHTRSRAWAKAKPPPVRASPAKRRQQAKGPRQVRAAVARAKRVVARTIAVVDR